MNSAVQRPPIRVAIMGLGRAQFADHYSVYRAHPALFRVVAACDVLKDRRDIVERDFPQCRMFRQFSDMLDERDIDLVDVSTCSADHAHHAMQALAKGVWTLLEPPAALTYEDAQLLRGAAVKAKNRLLMMDRGLFSPDFMLARQEMSDPRLGEVHKIVIRAGDYVRRDDWQAVKRLGGGAAYYAMPDLIVQALRLLPLPPAQMWSELKRVASLGDAEDYAHLLLKTRGSATADVEYDGGSLDPAKTPSFTLYGERGSFSVMPGAAEGLLTVIRPDFKFPRRRSSVRTPSLQDLHEDLPVERIPVTLPKETASGSSAFWRHVYATVRVAAPFPASLDESIEAVRFAHLMKKTSPFGK